ncbi:MAG: PAS domain-containing protein [Myxococcota bacterium]
MSVPAHGPSASGGVAIPLVGIDGERIASFNAAAARIFGVNADHARGTPAHQLFNASEGGELRESIGRAYGGMPSFIRLRCRHMERYVSLRVGPVSVGGTILGVSLVVLQVQDSAGAAVPAPARATQAPEPREDASGSETVSIVPGMLVEYAARESNTVLSLAEELYGHFRGQPSAAIRFMNAVFAHRSLREVRGELKASRPGWQLVQLVFTEDRSTPRTQAEFAQMRQFAMALEGAVGVEELGPSRRITMSWSLQRDERRRSEPPAAFENAVVLLDVAYAPRRSALEHRLRAWGLEVLTPRSARDSSPDVLTISDRTGAAPNVLRLGRDVPVPVRRAQLRSALHEKLRSA